MVENNDVIQDVMYWIYWIYWTILDSHMKTPGVVFILCNQHSVV